MMLVWDYQPENKMWSTSVWTITTQRYFLPFGVSYICTFTGFATGSYKNILHR